MWYRACVITKDSKGGLSGLAAYIGNSTEDYSEALEAAERHVKVGNASSAAVIAIVADVAVQRNVTTVEDVHKHGRG
jgi:hypothetical protein